jgi:hypothetical protein
MGLALGCQEAAAQADAISNVTTPPSPAPKEPGEVEALDPHEMVANSLPAQRADADAAVLTMAEGPTAPTPNNGDEAASPVRGAEPSSPANEASTIRVGLFRANGVSSYAFAKTVELLSTVDGIELVVLSPRRIRRGALRKVDVAIFTGGSGAAQGKALGEEGRYEVREWVRKGGGYVGICAGSYLAMQGEEEFHKLAILAGHNLTGDYWKRGVKDLEVVSRPSKVGEGGGAPRTLQLHFANGPLFEREKVEHVPAYVSLADFVGETYSTRNGTNPGEMPGTPAIVASRFGKGRLLLFSPNPILGEAEAQHPELFLDAIEWVDVGGKFPRKIGFEDVFDGVEPMHEGRHAPTPEHAELAQTSATAE